MIASSINRIQMVMAIPIAPSCSTSCRTVPHITAATSHTISFPSASVNFRLFQLRFFSASIQPQIKLSVHSTTMDPPVAPLGRYGPMKATNATHIVLTVALAKGNMCWSILRHKSCRYINTASVVEEA